MNLFVVHLTSGFLITAMLFGGGLLVLLPSLSSGDIVIFQNIKTLKGLIVSYLQGKSWTSLQHSPGKGNDKQAKEVDSPGLTPVHRAYTFRAAPQDLPSQNIGSPHTLVELKGNLKPRLADLAVRRKRGEGCVDELAAEEGLRWVAPLRQWLALAVMWVSAAARRRLTTCLTKRKMTRCISSLPNLVRILRTPITLVLMYCARKEQCGNVGDVLTHQKRFLVPPVPAVEGPIIDFCLRNTLGDAGSLNSGGAGDEGADDAVIVAILVVRENVALLPTRLRQLQLCAVALNTSQRVVLAASS
jgi:hypothetical protein